MGWLGMWLWLHWGVGGWLVWMCGGGGEGCIGGVREVAWRTCVCVWMRGRRNRRRVCCKRQTRCVTGHNGAQVRQSPSVISALRPGPAPHPASRPPPPRLPSSFCRSIGHALLLARLHWGRLSLGWNLSNPPHHHHHHPPTHSTHLPTTSRPLTCTMVSPGSRAHPASANTRSTGRCPPAAAFQAGAKSSLSSSTPASNSSHRTAASSPRFAAAATVHASIGNPRARSHASRVTADRRLPLLLLLALLPVLARPPAVAAAALAAAPPHAAGPRL